MELRTPQRHDRRLRQEEAVEQRVGRPVAGERVVDVQAARVRARRHGRPVCGGGRAACARAAPTAPRLRTSRSPCGAPSAASAEMRISSTGTAAEIRFYSIRGKRRLPLLEIASPTCANSLLNSMTGFLMRR
ncbi:hypothetical protein [Burkholderia ubonensis]|uniref:hypothetical protein n=1 Tax=Burkholderia ubonensis TaxID=101571 RepID=UPI00075BC47F|nr:hypothetical protein [Burkholderia ubonensis]KVC69784.1 hypothetical protein WI74_24695 [Burkholderia ubonensis]